MVLLFWCRLTQIVLEKRPLNECSSSSGMSYEYVVTDSGAVFQPRDPVVAGVVGIVSVLSKQ